MNSLSLFYHYQSRLIVLPKFGVQVCGLDVPYSEHNQLSTQRSDTLQYSRLEIISTPLLKRDKFVCVCVSEKNSDKWENE